MPLHLRAALQISDFMNFRGPYSKHLMGESLKRFISNKSLFGYRNNDPEAGLLIDSLPEVLSGRTMKATMFTLMNIASFVDRETQIQDGEFPVPDLTKYDDEVDSMDLIETGKALRLYDSSYIIPNDPAWEDAFNNPAVPAIYVWQKDPDGKMVKVLNTGNTTVFEAIKIIDPTFNSHYFKRYQIQRILSVCLFDSVDAQREAPDGYNALINPTNEINLQTDHDTVVSTRKTWNKVLFVLRATLKTARQMLKYREENM